MVVRVTILVTAELESLASLYSQQLMTLVSLSVCVFVLLVLTLVHSQQSKEDSDAPVTSLYLEVSSLFCETC